MADYLLNEKGSWPLDFNAPLGPRELPPLRPGELAREVIQFGYLTGLLHNDDEKRSRVDPSLINHPVIIRYLANENIKAIRRKCLYLAEKNFHREYIESFIQEVEEQKNHDSELAQLCTAVGEVRPDILHPYEIGILAVHCYYQDR